MSSSGGRNRRGVFDTTEVSMDVVTKALQKRNRCALLVVTGPMAGSLLSVDGNELELGRGPTLDDQSMSRQHARVFRSDETYNIQDLGSRNGTWVNGERLDSPHRLADGDRIRLGPSTELRVVLQDEIEHEAARKMHDAAIYDPLTQVYNRRLLDERLRSEFAFAKRHLTPLAVLVIDIDHFKHVNDTFGHQAGDEVLKAIGNALKSAIRAEDLVGRYGGEEFAIIVRGIDLQGVQVLAGRIRRLVERLSVEWKSQTIAVTASIGIAACNLGPGYETSEELLGAADGALYRAKEGGRNCCCVA